MAGSLTSSSNVIAALPKALDIPSSTAPMGRHSSPHAATDYQGRVNGIGNPRVADTSSFPDVLNADLLKFVAN